MFGIGKPEIKAVQKTIEKGWLTRFQGGTKGYLAKSERKVAQMTGVNHALFVNSGTSALICSMVALGVGPGDEVLISSYTWISTPLAPMLLGAIPKLVEIDESMTMDPKDLERKITKKTKAIVVIHMNNLPCDMNPIMKIAKKHGIAVVEDACQAVGGLYKGKRLGSIGAVGCFSFNNYKNISCGEGGAVLTNDDVLFDRARLYHDAGTFVQSYDCKIKIPYFAGQDYRASEIEGAIIWEQLKRLDPGMKKWRERVKFARELVESETNLKISKHNDPESAVTLTVLFKTQEEALEYATRNHMGRVIDSGRHNYLNWTPLREKLAYREDVNPFNTPAGKGVEYDENTCPVSLDLMARTCHLTPAWNASFKDIEKRIKSLN